jgi:hypothetical protein
LTLILLKNPNARKISPKRTIKAPSGKIKIVYTPFVSVIFRAVFAEANHGPEAGGFSAKSTLIIGAPHRQSTVAFDGTRTSSSISRRDLQFDDSGNPPAPGAGQAAARTSLRTITFDRGS